MARKVFEELETFVEAPRARLRARALFGVFVAAVACGVMAIMYSGGR